MTTPRYSALNSSRITRTASSGSRYSSVGQLAFFAFASIDVPLVEQAGHVGAQLVLGGVLGGGAHDEAVLGRLDPVEDVAQALAHVVGQALGDAVGLRVGDQHHEPAGQRHLLGQAGALGADRVLGDLADDQLLGPQHLLDAQVAPPFSTMSSASYCTSPRYSTAFFGRADVDERRLHAGQHVLHLAEVDVAVDLADVVGRAADVVLDEVAALEHGHLGERRADLHAHQVAADRATVALAPAALLEHVGVELGLTLTATAASPRPLPPRRRFFAAGVARPASAAGASLRRPVRRACAPALAALRRPARRRRRTGGGRPGVADLRLAHERPVGGLDRRHGSRRSARAARARRPRPAPAARRRAASAGVASVGRAPLRRAPASPHGLARRRRSAACGRRRSARRSVVAPIVVASSSSSAVVASSSRSRRRRRRRRHAARRAGLLAALAATRAAPALLRACRAR